MPVTGKDQFAAGNRFGSGAAGEGDRVAVERTVVLALLRRVIVAGTGQAAGEEHQLELTIAERDNLRADVVLAGQHPSVFALERIVGVDLGRVGCGNGNQPGQ